MIQKMAQKDDQPCAEQKKIEAELKFEFNKGGLMKTYYKGIL